MTEQKKRACRRIHVDDTFQRATELSTAFQVSAHFLLCKLEIIRAWVHALFPIDVKEQLCLVTEEQED